MKKNNQVPWELTGEGYLMFFKFPKSFILERGFLPENLKEDYFGNVGCIFIANYQNSNIGPYQELLFIPGKLRYQHRKHYTVSKNFVSIKPGAENGRNNWGITKELADFSFIKANQNFEHIKVNQNGKSIIDITIKTPRAKLPFPIRTFFKPYLFLQQLDGKTYLTKVQGKGDGKFTQILKIDVNPELFPNFAFFKHVAIIKLESFRLKLPLAKIKMENLVK